jgi:hypothetical protein
VNFTVHAPASPADDALIVPFPSSTNPRLDDALCVCVPRIAGLLKTYVSWFVHDQFP